MHCRAPGGIQPATDNLGGLQVVKTDSGNPDPGYQHLLQLRVLVRRSQQQ